MAICTIYTASYRCKPQSIYRDIGSLFVVEMIFKNIFYAIVINKLML